MDVNALMNSKGITVSYMDVNVTWGDLFGFSTKHGLSAAALAIIFNTKIRRMKHILKKCWNINKYAKRPLKGAEAVLLQLMINDPTVLPKIYKVEEK